MKKKIDILCFFSIIFSAIGWIVENLSRLFAYGIIDNRFHILPFIGAYGLIPFAFIAIGKPNEFSFLDINYLKRKIKLLKF